MEKEPKSQELSEKEIKNVGKERVLSDAELLQGGSDYVLEKGELRLDVPDYQQKIIKLGRAENTDLKEISYIDGRSYTHNMVPGYLDPSNIKIGDAVRVEISTFPEYHNKLGRLVGEPAEDKDEYETRTYDGIVTKFDTSNCMYYNRYEPCFTRMTLKYIDGTEEIFSLSKIKKGYKLEE